MNFEQESAECRLPLIPAGYIFVGRGTMEEGNIPSPREVLMATASSGDDMLWTYPWPKSSGPVSRGMERFVENWIDGGSGTDNSALYCVRHGSRVAELYGVSLDTHTPDGELIRKDLTSYEF